MDLQRTLEEEGSRSNGRPFPLITATLVSYLLATALSLNMGHADGLAAQGGDEPTPYSADHARITNEEALPPTF